MARHDEDRRSYIVLYAPHDVCSSRVAKLPLEKSHDGALVACLRLPSLHFRKSQALLWSATAFPPSPSGFEWRRVMTPGTPPNHGLSNATQSMRRLEAILSCGTKLRPNPTDQASRPAYYPIVTLSSKVYIPTS